MSKDDTKQHNRPGSRTNTPQHLAGTYGGPEKMRNAKREGIPTGEGTARTHHVVDPHPSDEEHPYREEQPGATGSAHSIRLVDQQRKLGA